MIYSPRLNGTLLITYIERVFQHPNPSSKELNDINLKDTAIKTIDITVRQHYFRNYLAKADNLP